MDGFDIVDPAFAALVLKNASLETLGSGYRWLEGPVWFADHHCLLFSDIPNDRVWRWSDAGITLFRQPSDFANGHTRDREGRLIECSHRGRCVTRTELDGTVTVLADRYQGRQLNSPNDVVVKSDGSVWFSDPHYGINTDYEGGRQAAELPATLYRLDPHRGRLEIAADDFAGPNGLAFSPDERLLYVAETGKQFDRHAARHIRVFDVAEDNRLRGGRIFHTVSPGAADGFRCDEAGNLWTSAADGVHCINPDGALLGKILVPSTVANVEFGGRHRSRLFICATHTLYAIYTNTRGSRLP
jgi:gluconolactonase